MTDSESISKVMEWLKYTPDIPNSKNEWGKIHTSKCKCGGTITAIRSTYKGHYSASCNKCDMRIIE